ncbi:DUF3224 domain-containing protein [Marinicella meishanensis]|uniref:DUF3224 domain-containing protein n=1 Tax=Marinicella meishanensis TaxID=2873263 RepID=UPI001CBC400B|nr:DUF3224 domain-containing protein [Marinicella sp. NBU2979]
MKISGQFNVNMQPQDLSFAGQHGQQLARMALDKSYQGDLSGSSSGEMLSAVSTTPGSAGYVAIEQVTGTLMGRSGSFVLQHYGVMNRGDSHLTLTVVPDSGTDELTGLTGQMDIRIEDGQHYYDFEYELG